MAFIGVLMLYTGYIYTNAYFGYFHLDNFAMGFSPDELVIRSLRLATMPVFEILTVALLLPTIPRLLRCLRVPERHLRKAVELGHMTAKAHHAFVAAGALLMALWSWIQSFAWVAPLLVAAGVLLGRIRSAIPAGQPREPVWRFAASLMIAGLCLIWIAALVAADLGRKDAHQDTQQLVRRVSVILLSTEQLNFAPPGPRVTDLGKGTHFRYRYTNLRLLIERDHRYYLLPTGWSRENSTYVIKDSDDVRIEIRSGTSLPRPLARESAAR
ncbi:hypothetical protein ABZV77_25875 [Streptomyces sp. NPDC004732]|uniref:hypothetical protein n=1 Tax=Streptomyces sp. NPDC004732 TaxID=3154290 RepID=UPI00339EDE2A